MNQWNNLVDIFGATWDEQNIPSVAADNVCIAWPSILQCINGWESDLASKTALDFGCGGGLFCRKLSQMGLQVTGCDEASDLLGVARKNNYRTTTISDCQTLYDSDETFDLITSIMVFQFIENIEAQLNTLIEKLNVNGLLVFAVFNPEFVVDVLGGRLPASAHDTLDFQGGVRIPVFNRSAVDYRAIVADRGLTEVYRDYPPFTEDFIREYNMPFPMACPEFLIQGFRKGV